MRKPTRAAVAAVGGALALTSIAHGTAPAQAAPSPGRTQIHASSVYPHVGVGTGAKSFTVTYRVTDSGSGVKRVAASAHNGKARLSATKTTCRGPRHDVTCTSYFTADPGRNLREGSAGSWRVRVGATGSTTVSGIGAEVSIEHTTRLTINATPEPVRNGRIITVYGTLTRSHWNARSYVGYGGQNVHLGFRRTDEPYYTWLATKATDRRGNVRVDLRAYRDGTFRYDYYGRDGVQRAASTPDFVDVR
ncbi:hypothetical protein [Streptomyces sp. NPDC047315]|uniref:hypothetical protein n=1 Tax=Streptomyces sp. NPDC047315 TaxID=3155142 RepID=UPI0033C91FAB